jgi:hypothetical protein
MIQGGLENYFELRFHVGITLITQVMGKCLPVRCRQRAIGTLPIAMATCRGKQALQAQRQHACTHHNRSELYTQANTAWVTQESALL